MQHHLLACRDRLAVIALIALIALEHLHVEMHALLVVRDHPHLDAHGRALLDLAQIADVRFERVECARSRAAAGVVETDAVHERIGREAVDQHVERVAQVAVVVDPFGFDRVAIDHRASPGTLRCEVRGFKT
ncbi:hypothetical protein BYI23_B012380 [Burkholderia sp. YI23]|nr:hypothetical protein BYI23_B012380 [Burkholderia sp. YI23]